MPSSDPWAFGLNHLLTIAGFAITLGIAGLGFRSFEKWKREKLEEKRIDIAIDALAVAYEAEFIFANIRSPMSYEYEWSEMEGLDDKVARMSAGPFYATLKRIEHHKVYFERVWKLQPRFMAVFGKDASKLFLKLHQARRTVEVSAQMLMRVAARRDTYRDTKFRDQLESDVWNTHEDIDRIHPMLNEFVLGIEKHCLPVVENRYAKKVVANDTDP